MDKNFDRYLEVKVELDAGRITRKLIPGGVEWFDADEAEYQAYTKKSVKKQSPKQKEE